MLFLKIVLILLIFNIEHSEEKKQNAIVKFFFDMAKMGRAFIANVAKTSTMKLPYFFSKNKVNVVDIKIPHFGKKIKIYNREKVEPVFKALDDKISDMISILDRFKPQMHLTRGLWGLTKLTVVFTGGTGLGMYFNIIL